MLYTDILLVDLLQEMEITDKARGLTDKIVKKNRQRGNLLKIME